MTALKNGACFAVGASAEPLVAGAIKAGTLAHSVWNGFNMAEAVHCEMQLFEIEDNYIIGDPLYRPFGHR